MNTGEMKLSGTTLRKQNEFSRPQAPGRRGSAACFLNRIITRLQRFVSQVAPLGYEDETGFHLGPGTGRPDFDSRGFGI